MKWRLITEAKTPSDEKSIDMSFNKDISDEKYTPTVDFMKNVYNKMNKEMFLNYLPDESEITFMVKQLGRNDEIGSAPFSKSQEKHELTPKAIVLNSSYKLTLHGWMEAMLHEMLHVSDYLLNPGNFYDPNYDAHGEWFLNQGKRFRKLGFNVTRFCDLDAEYDGTERMEEMKDGKQNFFLVFNKRAKTGKSNESVCFRINLADKDKAVKLLEKWGIKKSFLFSTRNSFSEEVDVWFPGKDVSLMSFNETTLTLYGPFTREELLDVSSPTVESEEDELDRYMKIARHIKGVVSVERKGDTVVVGIS